MNSIALSRVFSQITRHRISTTSAPRSHLFHTMTTNSNVETSNRIRLTQFSHGAGCGCKISPKCLDEILRSEIKSIVTENLLVGNETKDDAAVYDIGNGIGIISTTDFFMPIVDDPTEFGRIADVYAMGGTPIMAIAILGWPLNKIPIDAARQVVEGGRIACNGAGIPLSGGHSIDAPEPIFGLAVTENIKRNSTATPGCKLYLTKPIGIGILTTAEKKGILKPNDIGKATELMCQLNKIGTRISQIEGVKAMTDVTGFGLLGHLLEMCEGSGVLGRLYSPSVPVLEGVAEYIRAGSCPGGTARNYESYGYKAMRLDGCELDPYQQCLLCDPQTSGGLLIAVEGGEGERQLLEELGKQCLTECRPIGILAPISQSPKSGIFVVVE